MNHFFSLTWLKDTINLSDFHKRILVENIRNLRGSSSVSGQKIDFFFFYKSHLKHV